MSEFEEGPWRPWPPTEYATGVSYHDNSVWFVNDIFLIVNSKTAHLWNTMPRFLRILRIFPNWIAISVLKEISLLDAIFLALLTTILN